ncbi:MAG TPA: hypothetical protein VEK57_29345 [Thermoanaerobaculia bacterium]|nr:hypothetical protein [Thermoanaerobaculia bacterium]
MRFLEPAQLRGLDARALEELLGRTEAVIVAAEGELRGFAAAALLFADFAVLHPGSMLHLDAPEVWAGVTWRLGRGALRLYLSGAASFTAEDALTRGLCDDVTDAAPADWLAGWMRNRSPLALDSAATLIRARGGDALERAEFARLFAIGEPQEGLAAFLGKRPPRF